MGSNRDRIGTGHERSGSSSKKNLIRTDGLFEPEPVRTELWPSLIPMYVNSIIYVKKYNDYNCVMATFDYTRQSHNFD